MGITIMACGRRFGQGWGDNEEWRPNAPEIKKFDTLSQCRNFADTLTIYLDNTEGKVRVVEAVS